MIVDNDHERVGKWIQDHGGGFYRDGCKCVGLEKNNELIAGVMYDYFNGASIYAHIAIAGRLDREFLWYIFYYPFVQLNAKIIIGLVASDNHKARRLDEHLGFKLITEIKDGHPSGSLLIYGMYKHECKWLRIKRHDSFRSRKVG